MIDSTVPVFHRDCVDSTNLQAMELCRSGQTVPFWLVAREQTAGRGRGGRHWVSVPGNLYATLACKPDCKIDRLPQLSAVAAIVVFETLLRWINPRFLRLKWPNDCLVNDAKISGILIEVVSSDPPLLVIGFGINVDNRPDQSEYPTACISEYGSRANATEVFNELQKKLKLWLNTWAGGENFDLIRREWLSRSGSEGQRLTVNRKSAPRTGICRGLNAYGALLLELGDGTIETIYSGDVDTPHNEKRHA